MLKNTYAVSCAALLLLACTQLPPAFAQNSAPSGWEMNQQNAINQEAASGMLNGSQAAQLQNREAQIQQQQAAMMAQNGGTLTQGDRRQLDHELKGVNHQMGRDMHWDQMQNQGLMGNSMGQMFPSQMGGFRGNPMWQNGQQMSNPQWAAQNGMQMPLMNQGQWHNGNGQWQNGNGQWQNGNGQWQNGNGQWQNGNGQWQNNGQYPNEFHHHHHHGQYNNGGGFSGVNGFSSGGNNNFQGRNWNGNGQY